MDTKTRFRLTLIFISIYYLIELMINLFLVGYIIYHLIQNGIKTPEYNILLMIVCIIMIISNLIIPKLFRYLVYKNINNYLDTIR
jgi:membrane protein YdbS with pleckstrin-like domain